MAEHETQHHAQLAQALKDEVAPLVEQHACLRYFCNDHTYVRYLRARSWDLKKAVKMLMTTLEWRLTYKPHEIKWEDVKHEATAAKHQVYPVPDNEGRPIVLMRPRLENTKVPESQIKFLIYHLELASRMADASGVGKMAWLLDFEDYSLRNAPAIKTSMFTLNTLQNHYPERLGSAVCFHAPSLFTFTWRAVGPFIDPVTKNKIAFVSKGPGEKADMEARYNMPQMEACMGGGIKGFVYDYEKYAVRMQGHDAELQAAIAATAHAMKQEAAGGSSSGVQPERTSGSQASMGLDAEVVLSAHLKGLDLIKA